MKTRLSILLVLLTVAMGLALVSASVVVAGEPRSIPDGMVSSSPTLHLNLGPTDPIIDPAFAGAQIWDAGGFVANQLFLGLVRTDDETGAPIPDLATSWAVSPDATEFTFTLRSGLTWTDGNPLTAHDARYGILRSLDPANPVGIPAPLSWIVNAEEYKNGSITDPNLVGIMVLDYYHLKITLEKPAAFFPTILTWPMARPMPAWAIAAHPTDWTEPANIVTNGPYKLTAWTHGASMTLEKNPGYYEAASVQIGRVQFSMVDDAAAWGMYQAGQLDSAIVPPEEWNAASNDPVLAQQLHTAYSITGTFYNGFNTAKAPFDNLLVRKAFAASVNRQGLIDTILKYAEQPALTFTPPGVWGHVDGPAQGVGIGYDPVQARQWLAAAGYPNGSGLPPIAMVVGDRNGFTAQNQAVAAYLRQGWMNQLGATITISDMEWGAYLELMATDAPQVWQVRWWIDYQDAYNFLREGIDWIGGRAPFGFWNNPAYEGLVDLAAQTADLNTRASLYKQAEEILVETDAVMIPIFYNANGMATKPYLQRTYGDGGFGGRIADWRIIYRTFMPLILRHSGEY